MSMTNAVTPELALSYLGALSTDLRAAAVLDATGAHLAGDAALAARAAALLQDAGPGDVRRAPLGGDTLFAARSDRHAIAVQMGPHALPALVVCDLRATLEDLAA
jgi:hypothetical protein